MTGLRMVFGTLRQWHWISSAICLAGMLLFAITGITLNRAAWIAAQPVIQTVEVRVPAALLDDLPASGEAPLPDALQQWLAGQHGISVGQRLAQWSGHEVYLSMPRAGGDAWLSISLPDGELLYENADRGWIAFFNDLHKGRHTG